MHLIESTVIKLIIIHVDATSASNPSQLDQINSADNVHIEEKTEEKAVSSVETPSRLIQAPTKSGKL